MVWALALVGFMLACSLLLGAPFVPSKRKDLKNLFEALGEGDGRLFVDLGSGTGTVLRMAQNYGYIVVGYEINPFLWLVSWLRIRKKTGVVYLLPWQSGQIEAADVVYIFTASHYANSRAFSKINERAQVVSLAFDLPICEGRAKKAVSPFIIYEPKIS